MKDNGLCKTEKERLEEVVNKSVWVVVSKNIKENKLESIN